MLPNSPVINEIDIEKSCGILRHPKSAAIATDTYLRRIAPRTLTIYADSVYFRERAAINSFHSSLKSSRFSCLFYRWEQHPTYPFTPFGHCDISIAGPSRGGLARQVVGGDQRYLDSPLSVNLSTVSFHPCVTTDRPFRVCVYWSDQVLVRLSI